MPLTIFLTSGYSAVTKTFAVAGLRYCVGVGDESLKFRNRPLDPGNIVRSFDTVFGYPALMNALPDEGGGEEGGGGSPCCSCNENASLAGDAVLPACCPCSAP